MATVEFPAPLLASDEIPQVVRGGGVAVILTRLPSEGDALRFRIEMTTHMRDLNPYRFEQIIRLRDQTGKEFTPLAVEQMMGGGHHRTAAVRFPAPDPRATVVELLVRDVAGVPERVFRWDLQAPGPSKTGPLVREPRMR
jgi:hypothetical protein